MNLKRTLILSMMLLIMLLWALPAVAQPPTQEPADNPIITVTAEPVIPPDSTVIVVEQPPAPPESTAVDPSVQWVTSLITAALAVGSILFAYFTKQQKDNGVADALKDVLGELKNSRELLYEAIPPHVFNLVGGLLKEATAVLGTAYALSAEASQIFTPPEGSGSLTITPPAGATGTIEVDVKTDLANTPPA